MAEKMNFLEITTDAKTPHGNFYDGEIRKVSDEVAGFLIGNAWAKKLSVTLDVQSAHLGTKAEDLGNG